MNGDALTEIAKNSKSDLVSIFVICAVVVLAIIATIIPLYRARVKADEKKHAQSIERETLLMGVIRENSSAISELTSMIKNTNANCVICKTEQSEMIRNLSMEMQETRSLIDKAYAILIERKELKEDEQHA